MSKVPLNRKAYIDATFEVIAEVGVDKLSMRKVASYLGVSPMAMYKHFPNKDALLSATLDELIARADIYPDADLPWRQWVEHVSRGMYTALCEESSWVTLLGSLRLGTHAVAIIDVFVKKLTNAGFTVTQSLQAFFAVIQVSIGAACLQASMNREPEAYDPIDGQMLSLRQMYLKKTNEEDLMGVPGLDAIAEFDQLMTGLTLLLDALEAELMCL